MLNASPEVVNSYGIVGLFVMVVAKELVYIFQKKKNSDKSADVAHSLRRFNERSAGVDFRQMESDCKWLREVHSATDATGRLRWYDNSIELKEILKDLSRDLKDLTQAIRDNISTGHKLHQTVESLEKKVGQFKP